ncbi:asparaginase [Paenibacillus sp. SAF-054]|uniref:asparaginase n=1 Tax=unclassified Paenibacillus TaxID=185978 RepID=UPI003F802248
MSNILINVIRGLYVESTHLGSAVVVHADGNVLYEAGDPLLQIYTRSCIKPVQALPMMLSGTADQLSLSPRELAVCCASHNGEKMHTEAVQSMLDKAGLTTDHLNCGVHPQYSVEAYEELLSQGEKPGTIHNNCSGKHAGMLLEAKHGGYDLEGYTDIDHPLQRSVLEKLAELSGLGTNEIPAGQDGCGLPTYLLPLERLAYVYARLGKPEDLGEGMASAIQRLTDAMVDYPEMVGGTGEFDTILMQQTRGKVIGKIGAEGVYCMAIPERGLGVALKIHDGNRRAAYPAAMEILQQLQILHPEEMEQLSGFHKPVQKNHRGEEVGSIEPDFCLTKVQRPLMKEYNRF